MIVAMFFVVNNACNDSIKSPMEIDNHNSLQALIKMSIRSNCVYELWLREVPPVHYVQGNER